MKEATEEELIQFDRQIRGETLVKGFDIEFWTGLVIATSETKDGHSAYKILENKIQEKKFVKKIEMLESILKQEKYSKMSKKFPSICNKLKTIKDVMEKQFHDGKQ